MLLPFTQVGLVHGGREIEAVFAKSR